MADFLRRLPQPQRQESLEVADASVASFKTVASTPSPAVRGPPPYGRRQGWTPRSLADFGDGGAFPEIHVAQYPLDMGKAPASEKVVALQVDANGRVAWDAVLKQGSAKDKLAIWTRPEDMREKWSKSEDLERPTQELDMLNTERTQKALETILNGKMQAGLPKRLEKKEPEFVRYTPNPDAPGYTPNCRERVIKLVEKQVDPMMPPRFKHKKVPRGPPSPPPPVHHSPARKLTAKDQKDWKVPPCVSNWKNSKGYTIPLDKRLAADGRNLQDVAVNDKFAALSEDLYLAERKAREEIKIRNDMIRQKKVREEEIREQQLRDLATQARQQRAELAERPTQEGETAREAEERKKRMEVLKDRQREIERDQRLELAGKTNKKSRDDDRDISERIALGQVAQPTSQEALYDARLFNQSAGMDSGYHGGSDERCAVYDKPLFADRSQAGIYRFDRERLEQNEGRLAHIGTKSFAGAADSSEPQSVLPRTAPVEFEREDSEPRRRARDASRERTGRGRDRDRGRSRSRRRGRDADEDGDTFGLDGLLEETRKKR
uniref:SKI-interacting protein SKIP SNW domain-containing protein n=1 Tax=Pyrodinium bahamense TaxID=73915 RepID=A0A7S0B6F3_9DINO